MSIIIKRLSDGEILDYSDKTYMVPTATVFGASFEKTFYPGPNGESILLSSALNYKTFTFTWVSGDQTGDDTRDIMVFFSDGDWFSITDTDLGLVNFEFAVLDINPDFTKPGITCQARWGAEPKFNLVSLSHQELAAGANAAAVNTSFTNLERKDASIRLTVTAAANTFWNPLIGGTLEIENSDSQVIGRVNFSFARLSNKTGSPITWDGVSVVIDSDREILEGEALISPVTWIPFIIEPNETVTVKLNPIQAPFTSSLVPWTLDLDAVVIERN